MATNIELLTVRRKPSTVEDLVRLADRIRRHGGPDGGELTFYELAKLADVDLNTVQRFFTGYTQLGGKAPVADRTTPGRTRLASALAIIQALGCDLEVVALAAGRRD